MMNYKYANINDYTEKEYKNFLKQIRNEKKERIKKIKKETTKKQSILGEILLIDLLHENKIDYSNCSFETNFYGKPYIKDNPIYFNISHSYDYVIVILSKKEIGIDIEKIRDCSLKTLNVFAGTKEQKQIIQSKNQKETYWTLYTLKEAYVKMKGTSIKDLKTIEYDLQNNTCNKKITFKTLSIIPEYMVSYCEKKL